MRKAGLLVQVDVTPGKLEELREVYAAFHEGTQKAPGLICSHIMQCSDDFDKLYIFEIWESAEARDSHLTSERYREFGEAMHGLDTPEGFIKTLVPCL